MRILLVHTEYRQPGGEDSAVRLQIDLLRENGHEVFTHMAANPSGLKALPTLLGAVWNPSAANDLQKAIASTQPDVVHVHNTWFAMSPSVISRASDLDLPVVMTLHNFRLACANSLLLREGRPCLNCVGSNPRDAVRYRCYRGLGGSLLAAGSISFHARRGTWTRDVDRFLVMSRFARDVLVQHGLQEHKISVVPQVVPDPGPRYSPPSESDFVLFVGRLSHEKGLDIALEAWRRFASPDLELHIIGDGPLRNLAETSGISGVRYLGTRTLAQVVDSMLRARAALMPSICFESAPMVAIEAMAAGLPAFGTNHGGLGELVGSVDRRLAVTPGEQEAWDNALETLNDSQTLDALGSSSRLRYSSHHTTQRGVQNLTDIYESVA